MRKVIFDIESDGLLDDVTKVHVLSYQFVGESEEDEVKTISDPIRIQQFFRQDFTFIGHNIILYDLPVIKKLFGIEVPYKKCIDTLALSWHLNENRLKHGLESYGSEIEGLEKVKIEDSEWVEGDLSKMTERCERDVAINMVVYKQQMELLNELYEGNQEAINKLINYLSFKLDCVREQEEVGLRLDIPRIESGIETLTKLAEEKEAALTSAMPKVPKISKRSKPKVMHKKDGSISAVGQRWLDLLEEHDIPEDFEGEVEYIVGYDKPNPNSSKQKKDWLFSLGWKPEHFTYVDEPGSRTKRKIPQIGHRDDNTKLCPSVMKLVEKEPAIEHMAGLTTINHRIGVLKGFLRDRKGDRIYAGIGGFAASLRLKHRVLVNLPGVSEPYAKDIRNSLIADEGKTLINTDLKGIEDVSKRNYIWPYDKAYVEELNDPDFDPHTSIAVQAGFMTKEEEIFYKEVDRSEDRSKYSDADITKWKRLKDIRQKGKVANFSCTYSVGAPTLALNTGLTEHQAKKLINSYWEKNWAVLKFVEDLDKKEVDGRRWVKNPVTGFWLPLRNEKDAFSCVNQSTGQYVLDMYIGFTRLHNIKVCYAYHDEQTFNSDNVDRDKKILEKCIQKVNDILKFKVKIECSVETGHRYGECH